MSSRGEVSYETAKELARIVKPLVVKSPHCVYNTSKFVQQIKCIQLQQGECIMSYDVKALFTSIPIGPTTSIIRKHLEQDKDLQQRTTMTVNDIICVLEFCLKNTYFIFKGTYCEQLEGAAMGSPIRPIVANVYMEDFETQTLNTSPQPPSLWKRYVNDTFVDFKTADRSSFLEHINSIDQCIQFTREESGTDGCMPFQKIYVIPQPDGSLITAVYRKPTHIDLYLEWDSHHTISAKYSVVSMLYNRARAVCSSLHLLQKEEHLHKILARCKYPLWALNRMKLKIITPASQINNKRGTNTCASNTSNNQRPHMVIPYTTGLSESLKNVSSKHRVQVYFRGGRTIKGLPVDPKDKDPVIKKSGFI